MVKKYGKRLTDVYKKLGDERASYSLKGAVEALRSCANCKFDETVDCALVLGVDVRKADQKIRGVFQPVYGLGKAVRIAVFASADKAEEARKAGADLVGDEDLIDKVLQDKGIAADVCIATPDMMPSVAKLGRILGTKGLLPNPKLGTVTADLARVIAEARKGRIEYSVDRSGIMRVGLAKVSFPVEKIVGNILEFVKTIVQLCPSGIKGAFVQRIFLSSTMGPSFELDLKSIADEGVSVC